MPRIDWSCVEFRLVKRSFGWLCASTFNDQVRGSGNTAENAIRDFKEQHRRWRLIYG